MDALLIVGGLLLILSGLVWLVARAFSTSLLWGCGSLLPPLTLGFIVAHWRRAASPVLLAGMGFIPLVVGVTMLASHNPERLAAIVSLSWLEPEPKDDSGLEIRLLGEFNGDPFAPRLGELVDGTLVLREGDSFTHRELSIRLPGYRGGDLNVDVLPEDFAELPQIELKWQLPDQHFPESRMINGGYTLHLSLRAEAPNLLRGDFHLVLPAGYRTSLSGTVELFTNRLRYRGERVDTRYNSQETLAWVVRDYLQRKFRTRAVELEPMPLLNLDAQQLAFEIGARIAGATQRVSISLIRSELQGWRVQGDAAPELPPPSAEELQRTAPVPTTIVRGEERPVDRRIGFTLERLLSSPSRFLGAMIRVQTERGRSAEGRFAGLNADGRLVIQHALGGQGEANFILRPSEVVAIELLEP